MKTIQYSLIIGLLIYLSGCGSSRSAPRPAPRPLPKETGAANQGVPVVPDRPELPVKEGVTDIFWLESETLMPVLEDAQTANKPVFVSFHASWCAPCKVMEEDIYTQSQVYEYVNDHFLSMRTDYDSDAGKTIAAIYEVDRLPTILFLSPKGVVLVRQTGSVSGAALRLLAEQAVTKMK